MPRQNKLSKLVAVFDALHAALATVDDKVALQLCENWKKVRTKYVEPSGKHPRSTLASGMEQGLREIPLLLEPMSRVARAEAAKALAAAVIAHYPDFIAKDLARLEEIKSRGRIRGENEFHLARHQVDLLEGDASRTAELQEWYRLIDAFEARKR